MQATTLPVTVNYHLNKNCNFRCKGCYAVFNDEPSARGVMLSRERMFRIVEAVAAAPLPEGTTVRKLTFAGGEPTLCPWLPELIDHAKDLGLVTMLVTNGSRCSSDYLRRVSASLDWLTLSVDSLVPATNLAIGRHDAKGQPISRNAYARVLADAAALGLRTKVNTVVSSRNHHEDMSGFIAGSGIDRWKVLQVMAVDGQNDEHYAALSVSRRAFDAFISRHRRVGDTGVRLVPETADAIRGSYAMIDPKGRFFDSAAGRHRYSRPILDIGVATAFGEISFDSAAFESRGGSYDFGGAPESVTSGDIRSIAALQATR